MKRYARIRFAGKTAILEITGENDVLLRGIEVDRFGAPIKPKGLADERLRVISKDLITRRTPLVMDRHYGELVEEPETGDEVEVLEAVAHCRRCHGETR